ncbi:WD_REPEATS_REGION domain-containing protein, partial [Mortierella sp. AD031]
MAVPSQDNPSLQSTSSVSVLCASSNGHSRLQSISSTDATISNSNCSDGDSATVSTGLSSRQGFFKRMPLFRKSGSKKMKVLPLASRDLVESQASSIIVTIPSSAGISIVPGARESSASRIAQPVDAHDTTVKPRVKSKSRNLKALFSLPTLFNIRYRIFLENSPRSLIGPTALTCPYTRIESTLQLVFCAGMLLKRLPFLSGYDISREFAFTDAERQWLGGIEQSPMELARIQWLLSRVVTEFVESGFKGSTAIAEVVILGPVLFRADYRTLLSCFVETFEQASILDVDLLQGMVQLVQSALPGYLLDDDLVRILGIFRVRLEETHPPMTGHIHHLVLALSKVLEVMVSGVVKDLDEIRDQQPLLDALLGLRGSGDNGLLEFQIDHALQGLLYLQEDETPLQAMWRYSESAVGGVTTCAADVWPGLKKVLSAVKRLQQVIGDNDDVLKTAADDPRANGVAEEGGFRGIKDEYQPRRKQAWYLALQAANVFVRKGQLVEFNRFVCVAACRFDLNFQRGVCQILGEIAVDPLWDIVNRQRAITFLGELYKNNTKRRKDPEVETWIISILHQISCMEYLAIKDFVRTVLDDLQRERTVETQRYSLLSIQLPLPTSFVLLNRALDMLYIEQDLDDLRRQRLEESCPPVLIPLQAKADLQASAEDVFPLMEQVQDFLLSTRQIFLVLGDSGSGKSTFSRHLERGLWTKYREGRRIPLFINLASIDRPEDDLVAKHLRQLNFSESKIQVLKRYRIFVLVCDGYDESRLTANLHTTNRLNQPGQWKVKMIISCRNTYLHHDYHGRFRPQGVGRYSDSRQDQIDEAVIIPFSQDDVRSYVERHVRASSASASSGEQSVPTVDEYMYKLWAIPDMMDLVKNPFLLKLALETLPSVSIDADNPSAIEATRLQLYDDFIKQWIRISKKRLEQTNLNQETNTAFEQLLEADFGRCVTGYLKNLAEAIYRNQDGRPVVEYIHLLDKKTWRAEFFGPEIQSTLLREASPLSRAGIRHWFLHQSLLEYFYALTMYDPSDSDQDSSKKDTDDGADGGGNSSSGGGDGSDGGKDDSAGGVDSQGVGENSQGDGSGSHGGGGNSIQGGDDYSGASHGSTGGSGDPSNDGDDSPDNNQGPSDQSDGSERPKDGSDGDKDDSRQNKDASRSKGKGTSREKTRPSMSDNPFSKRNLFKEPAVLQFLVERA